MTIKGIIGSIVGFFALIVVLSVTLGSWYTIDEAERGIVFRNGAFVSLSEPGLKYKLPIVDEVVKISLREQTILYEKVPVYSRDQQTADLRISVQYSVPADQVLEVYQKYGTAENMAHQLINRAVSERAETIFGQFAAITAIQERGRLSTDVSGAIRSSIKGPITIHNVQVENIDFSDAYEAAIEDRMKAEVEVQKRRQELEQNKVAAEIAVTQAQGRADSVLAEAEANAKAKILLGEAEATAINARGRSIRENPSVVSLVQAEKWNGVLPTQMVPGSAVPFLNLKAE